MGFKEREAYLGRDGLGHTKGGFTVNDLSVQIGQIDYIMVHQTQTP